MPIIKKCANCGKEISIKPSHEKEYNYCSKKCSNSHLFEKLIKRKEEELGINMSEWIYEKYVIEKVSLHKIGEILKVTNRIPPKILKYYNIDKRTQSKSIECQWINNDKRKAKQSEFAKNKLTTDEAKEKRKHIFSTEEYKKKQSISKTGNKNGMYKKYGALNPAYNPNLTEEERILGRHIIGYKEWRGKVYERDNYTCQCCGNNKGGNLNAHHIANYSTNKDKRVCINNGITLCEKCHKAFHKKYGYKNNSKKQLEEFIKCNKYAEK